MSTTPEARELAETIQAVTDQWDERLDEVHDIPPIVNAVLAAGYAKPAPVPAGGRDGEVAELRAELKQLQVDCDERFIDSPHQTAKYYARARKAEHQLTEARGEVERLRAELKWVHDDRNQWMLQAESKSAVLGAVAALHRPDTVTASPNKPFCLGCPTVVDWPCETAAVLAPVSGAVAGTADIEHEFRPDHAEVMADLTARAHAATSPGQAFYLAALAVHYARDETFPVDNAYAGIVRARRIIEDISGVGIKDHALYGLTTPVVGHEQEVRAEEFAKVWDEAIAAHVKAMESWYEPSSAERMYWPDVLNPYRPSLAVRTTGETR